MRNAMEDPKNGQYDPIVMGWTFVYHATMYDFQPEMLLYRKDWVGRKKMTVAKVLRLIDHRAWKSRKGKA